MRTLFLSFCSRVIQRKSTYSSCWLSHLYFSQKKKELKLYFKKKKERRFQSVPKKIKKKVINLHFSTTKKNLLRGTSGSLQSCPPNTLVFSLSDNMHGVLLLVTPFLFLIFFFFPFALLKKSLVEINHLPNNMM